jgi:hypothetical protein
MRANAESFKSWLLADRGRLEGSEPLSAYAPARSRSGDRQLVRRDLVS